MQACHRMLSTVRRLSTAWHIVMSNWHHKELRPRKSHPLKKRWRRGYLQPQLRTQTKVARTSSMTALEETILWLRCHQHSTNSLTLISVMVTRLKKVNEALLNRWSSVSLQRTRGDNHTSLSLTSASPSLAWRKSWASTKTRAMA